MGHGEAGGYRGGAPRPRRDLGSAIPPPGTLGEEPGAGRPGSVRDHRRDRRWSRIAPGFSADQPQRAVAGARSPAPGPAEPKADQDSDVTSSAPSERPGTPDDGPTTRDPGTTGTGPAGPPDEQRAENPASHPHRTPADWSCPCHARTPARPPGNGVTAHAAGRIRADERLDSCREAPFRWPAMSCQSRIRGWFAQEVMLAAAGPLSCHTIATS
jgi:hypothetical protein